MKKVIRLNEHDISKMVNKVLSEQSSHSSETWQNQKNAEESNKYCIPAGNVGKPFTHYEGQYCIIKTKWFDWSSSTIPTHTNVSEAGKWKCGVGCVPLKGVDY